MRCRRTAVQICIGCATLLLGGCDGGKSPVSPTQTVNIAGTWDVVFEGTIVPMGSPQEAEPSRESGS